MQCACHVTVPDKCCLGSAQRLILSGVLHDIIIFGKIFEQLLLNLHSVLEQNCESGAKVKTCKCSFLQSKAHYLGHIISQNGIPPDPSSWPSPTTNDETHWLAGYYKKTLPTLLNHFSDWQGKMWCKICRCTRDSISRDKTVAAI